MANTPGGEVSRLSASSSDDDLEVEVVEGTPRSVPDSAVLAALRHVVVLEETHHLNQSGIPYVCNVVKEARVEALQQIQTIVKQPNCQIQQVQLAIETAIGADPWSKVNSEDKVKRILKNHCSFVAPQKIVLSSYFDSEIIDGESQVVQKSDTAITIPFKRSLEVFLENDEIFGFVHDKKQADNDYLTCAADGSIYCKNNIVLNYENPLIFQLYEDDCEFVNPLGSHVKKHKMTNIYWSLLNLPPCVRSSLKSINLLALCKATNIKKHGFSCVLKEFIEAIMLLESPQGLSLEIHGKKVVYHGTLLNVVGDGLALNGLGGFKESIGWAKHPCRNCLLDRDSMETQFLESEMPMRSFELHNKQLSELENPSLKKKEREELSTKYGIVSKSPLLQIKTFDVTKCLPQDLFHNILEGVLDLEMKYILKQFIELESLLTFDDLNEALAKFNYPDAFKRDIPSRIDKSHVNDGNLRQSGAQTITLLYVLPFILASYVAHTDKFYSNFLLLCQISNVLLAYKVKKTSIPSLKNMINMHNLRFKDLYGKIIPKVHFLSHAPTVISESGPCRETWTMRYEGRHAYFGKIAQHCNNFKNLEYTLAHRYQVKRCMELGFGNRAATVLSENLFRLELGDTVPKQLYKLGQVVANTLNIPVVHDTLQAVSVLHYENFEFLQKTIVLISESELEYPEFGSVVSLFTYDKKIALIVNRLETNFFDFARNAFSVTKSDRFECILFTDLAATQPFPLFEVSEKLYVVLTYFDHTEFAG